MHGDPRNGDLPAGDFAAWLHTMQAALRDEVPAEVPCDGCTACCTSSQFVHIDPDEADTLAHIPAGLLFPAPGQPSGHVLLGYDDNGHCPMLADGRCSIYEHRPRTCRTYDCRVFAAAGIEPDEETKVLIRDRVRRWRFSFPSEADRAEHASVAARAAAMADADADATNATARAVAAVSDQAEAAPPAGGPPAMPPSSSSTAPSR